MWEQHQPQRLGTRQAQGRGRLGLRAWDGLQRRAMHLGLVGAVVEPEPQDGRGWRREVHDGRDPVVEDEELQQDRRAAKQLDIAMRQEASRGPAVQAREGEHESERDRERHRQKRDGKRDSRGPDEQDDLRPVKRRGRRFVRLRGRGLRRQLGQPPAREDPPQLASRVQFLQRGVHRVPQVLVALAHPDHVRPARHVSVRQLQVRLGQAVPRRDQRIEQDRVRASDLQVPVRLLLPAVEHDLDPRTPAEDLVRERRRQRAHPMSAERVQGPERGSTPDHELLRELEVRPRQENPPAQRLGVLQPVHDQIEIPALERRYQVRPVVVHEPLADAEVRRQRANQIDLEPDQLVGIARIAEHVRLPTLQVAAPADLTLRADAGEPGGREQQCERQRTDRHLRKLPRRRSPW